MTSDKQRPETKLGERLTALGLTVSVAESCTAGGLASRMTDVPGSSAYFLGGIIAYRNSVKTSLLDVPEALFAEFGAVSRQTAEAMARGCLARLGSDVAVSITGIAGPGGGSPEKPLGLVYIAVADSESLRCSEFRFDGDRAAVRESAIDAALRLLLAFLES